MMGRRVRFLHEFRLALLLQAVLLELLRIDRLLAALVLRRPAFATIGTVAPVRTIAPVAAAAASAAASTAPAPMLFAFLRRT